jgi:hypothetical protein
MPDIGNLGPIFPGSIPRGLLFCLVNTPGAGRAISPCRQAQDAALSIVFSTAHFATIYRDLARLTPSRARHHVTDLSD